MSRAEPLRRRTWSSRARGLCAQACVFLLPLASAGTFARPARGQELAPEAAVASDPGAAERVVRLNEEGARLYAAGDYQRALSHFQDAYALEADPHLLFNIASCHRGLGDTRAALSNYRTFLRAPGTDPEGRARAEQAIEAIEQERAPVEAPPVPKASAAPPIAAEREPAPSWLDDPIVPWVTIGTGSAALLLGGSLYALGASDHERLEETTGFGNSGAVTNLTRAEARELVDAGNTKKAAGVASLVFGAALLTSYGVVRFLRDSEESAPEPSSEPQWAVVPWRSGGTVSFTGSF